MAHQLIRPLRQWPRLQYHCISTPTLHHSLSSPSLFSTKAISHLLSFTKPPSLHSNRHFRSYGLRLPNDPAPSHLQETAGEQDSDVKRSRNERKREARRAVRWGMELAAFSTPQIKRILRMASLEREVFDALMLVKRLGPDVREGKRRQFNYIGRLLRGVQPELMDALIQASKDGDQSRLQALSGLDTRVVEEDGEEDEADEEDYEEEDEESNTYIDIATRWSDGLINKDIDVTNEVYSVHSVEFDRQELRKLVRKVHSIQDYQAIIKEEEDVALLGAKKSLFQFLHTLAKQLPTE